MSKLYSSREIEAVLKRLGFQFISQKGSHAKYKKGSDTVIVPASKKEIPLGTFHSILEQAGISLNTFLNHL